MPKTARCLAGAPRSALRSSRGGSGRPVPPFTVRTTMGVGVTHAATLEALGWDAGRAEELAPYAAEGLLPGRVGVQHRGGYVLFVPGGELRADAAPRLRREGLPAVGDWVAYEQRPEGTGLVRAILPRRTAFTRARRDLGSPGAAATEQVIAANVDVILIVSALVGDHSVRRLERYLAAAWESGAEPAVVLTKADLCDDVAGALAEARAVAPGVPVHAVSNVTGEGLDAVRARLAENRTVALVGSSGAGKSTLVNRLLGRAAQEVRETRADGSGRHTTTARRLFLVPGGGLILDTPGLRVVEPWQGEALDAAFPEVEELAAGCRFSDCRHESEPGCAVRAAIADGRLDPARLEGYLRLERETSSLARTGGRAAESAGGRRRRAAQDRAERDEEELR